MDKMAKDLMVDVNIQIGDTLCTNLSPGEILVVSSGSAMIFEGTMVCSDMGFCD